MVRPPKKMPRGKARNCKGRKGRRKPRSGQPNGRRLELGAVRAAAEAVPPGESPRAPGLMTQ
jgi:hypothetical protein